MSEHYEHPEQECGCGEGSAQCSCDCGGVSDQFRRHYQTREEQTQALENYLQDLKLELQAVEEQLADLRK